MKKFEPALDPSEGEVIRFKLCESDVVCDSVVVKIGLFAKNESRPKPTNIRHFGIKTAWHKVKIESIAEVIEAMDIRDSFKKEANPSSDHKNYLNENCDIPLGVRQTAYMILTREGMDPKMVRYCDLRKMIFELADSYGLIKIPKGLRESFSRESALVSAK